MKIKSLSIRNFKTYGNTPVSFTLNSLTALVGENSAGKSNVLEALDLFFNFSKSKMSIKSFHHDDFFNPIVIEITFNQLDTIETKTFRSHLDDNKNLTISQQIRAISTIEDRTIEQIDIDEIDFEESKHGTKLEPTEDFSWAIFSDEKTPTKTNIKAWWKGDLKVGDFDFKTLFQDKNDPTPETYQEKLSILWDTHGDQIPLKRVQGDEKILGWRNKLKANLPKYFYIPAIKNVSDDLRVTKTSPFGELINWLSKSVSNDIREEFKESSSKLIDNLLSKIDKDEQGNSKIAKINFALNDNVGFDIGCKLELRFGSPEIDDIIFPQPKIFANDGYNSELTGKGHGVQRLAIFSLLRTYNTFDFGKSTSLRNMIIGIEEPELYLHPPLKRSTYSLLRKISLGADQVIYCTHDSLFLSVENFDEIRLFRKSEGSNPNTNVYELSVDQLVKFYKEKYGVEIDEKSIRHRFHHIIDESKNEGFFAKKIILIEGETEKYAIPNYFKAKGFEVDTNRIALITAGSVDSITYLLLIFNEFHIPCYVIFDGDKPTSDPSTLSGQQRTNAADKSRRNKELFNFLNIPFVETPFFFPPTSIEHNFAVWEKDFESVFHKTLVNYETLKSRAKSLYGNDSKPLTARYISEEISRNSDSLDPKIDQFIEKLKALRWSHSILCS